MSPHAVRSRRAREKWVLRDSAPTYVGVWDIRKMKDWMASCYVQSLIGKALKKRGYGFQARLIFWETLGMIVVSKPDTSITESMARHVLKNLDRYIYLVGI